jgi:hypothetical protein
VNSQANRINQTRREERSVLVMRPSDNEERIASKGRFGGSDKSDKLITTN